jgi:hypothetical protein
MSARFARKACSHGMLKATQKNLCGSAAVREMIRYQAIGHR